MERLTSIGPSQASSEALADAKLSNFCLSTFCERFNFFGSLSILLIYLTQSFLLSDDQAFTLFGIYASLAFLSPLWGAFICKNFLNKTTAFVLGAILIIIGNTLLALTSLELMHWGLAIMILGIGLYRSDHQQTSDPKDNKQNYFHQHIAGLLGPLCYGVIAITSTIHNAFMASIIMMLASLFIFAYQHSIQNQNSIEKTQKNKSKRLTVFFLLLASIVITIKLMDYPEQYPFIFVICLSIAAYALTVLLMNSKPITRHRLLTFIAISAIAVFFLATSIFTLSSTTLLINRDLNHRLLSILIPSNAFPGLEALSVLMILPFITKISTFLNKKSLLPSPNKQFLFGLALSIAAIFCFAYSANPLSYQSHKPLLGLLGGNALLALGEVCIIPYWYRQLTHLIPPAFHQTGKAIMFASIGGACFIGSSLARLTDNPGFVWNTIGRYQSLEIYHRSYMHYGLLLINIVIILGIMSQFSKGVATKANPVNA